MPDYKKKYQTLLEQLSAYPGLTVAFSGGVDSTLLLYAAKEALGERASAVIAVTASFPKKEQEKAVLFCREQEIAYTILELDQLGIPYFAENTPERCYFCKKAIFSAIKVRGEELGKPIVAEGSNRDDLKDYRPGRRALEELSVVSPLLDAALTKEEIRLLSKEKGLSTWNQPSLACLSTRIAYGEEITEEKLHRIELAEELLQKEGFTQVRVRLHGSLARIEILPQEWEKFDWENRKKIHDALLEMGFSYVTVDLGGFLSGSMNRLLKE